MTKKKVFLICGANGFIGRHLTSYLAQFGTVVAIDRVFAPNENVDSRVDVLTGDSGSVNILKCLREYPKFDACYYLGGLTSFSIDHNYTHVETELRHLNSFLEYCRSFNIFDRFIFFSTSSLYGNFSGERVNEAHPLDCRKPYTLFKMMAENLVRYWQSQSELPTLVFRLSNVFGPNDEKERVVQKAISSFENNSSFSIYGDGNDIFDFTYIMDVLKASLLSSEYNSPSLQALNISSGVAWSINELITILELLFRKTVCIERNQRHSLATLTKGALSNDKANLLLGFRPEYDLKTGLSHMLSLPTPQAPQLIKTISLARPSIIYEDVKSVQESLQSDTIAGGKVVTAFEKGLVEKFGAKYHAVALNSCTSAITLALLAANIQGEVIVPAFTFYATSNAVIAAGCTPVFVDIEAETMGINPDELLGAITPNTKAIIAVHLYGRLCNIERIHEVANAHNLFLIEDAAQAWAGVRNGSNVGEYSDAACFSFFPTKLVTCGEGGALISKNSELISLARQYASHGTKLNTSHMPWKRRQGLFGYNNRMPAPLAALALSQIKRTEKLKQDRIRICQYYRGLLDLDYFELPFQRVPEEGIFTGMICLLHKKIPRDSFLNQMRKNEVEASAHYDIPVPYQPVFKRDKIFSVSEDVSSRIISLPTYFAMTEVDIERVANQANIAAKALI